MNRFAVRTVDNTHFAEVFPTLKLMRAIALASVFFTTVTLAQTSARPNILLLMAEDMGPRVGAFGDSVAVTPHLDAFMVRHYNNIAYMDGEVGEILKQLEADGLADSTIVIWTTDHGDGLPRAKRELYDSGIKVPMIIRWPQAFRPEGVEPGAVDERLFSFVDLAPTILSLAGVQVPAYIQGRNFVAMDATSREYVYASRDRIDEMMDRQRAVRDTRWNIAWTAAAGVCISSRSMSEQKI